jgi:hypothetical protein
MKQLLNVAACALLLALPGCGDCCKKCEPTEQTDKEHVHTDACCHEDAAAQKENYKPAE